MRIPITNAKSFPLQERTINFDNILHSMDEIIIQFTSIRMKLWLSWTKIGF